MVKKIVVSQPLGLTRSQRERVKKLGDATFYDTMPESPEEWFDRVMNADIVLTGKFGLKVKWSELRDMLISVPFVAVDWADKDVLQKNNVIIKNSPGCNKEPVSEWVVGMIINLLRRFPDRINTKHSIVFNPAKTLSLAGKTVCIVGMGNIGTRLKKVCEALAMHVVSFQRGDNLIDKAKVADVIVDVLGANDETYHIYDRTFFQSLKKGSYFVTVTSEKLWDTDAMFEALDQGILAGVANDVGSVLVGNVDSELYQRFARHPKVYATPHVAWESDRGDFVCNEMMIQNLEDYLAAS